MAGGLGTPGVLRTLPHAEKRDLPMNTRRVINASLLVGFFFGLDKIIALGRQVLVGRAYGVTASLDAFNAANNLPDAIAAVIFGSALTMAFIPILAETFDREGSAVAWELFSRVANWAFVLTAGLALLIVIFADPLVRYVVVPSFPPERQALTAGIMRLDVISLLIFSISGTTRFLLNISTASSGASAFNL